MAAELVSLSRTLNRAGVEADTDDAAELLLLLRAVSEKARGLTNRTWAGTATVYDQIVDTGYSSEFLLPDVPVTDLLSVALVHWDMSEDDIWTPESVTYPAAGWTTALSAAVSAGDTNLKVDAVTDIEVGDHVSSSTEVQRITAVGTAGAGGTGLTVEPAAKFTHALGAAVAEVDGSDWWRLTDAARGRVEMLGTYRFVRCVWRVTGTVPVDVQDAVLEWVASRWAEKERSAGLSSYSTGADSESYDTDIAGAPPQTVALTLSRYWRKTRSGVI